MSREADLLVVPLIQRSLNLIAGLPREEGWEFGLDQAGTHLFGAKFEKTRIHIWMYDILGSREKTLGFDFPQIPDHRIGWFGPQYVQSEFGTVVLANYHHRRLVWSSWDSKMIETITYDEEVGSRFTVDTSLLKRGKAPIRIWDPGGSTYTVDLSRRSIASERKDPNRVPWLHPITRNRIPQRRPSLFHSDSRPESSLIPAGGLPCYHVREPWNTAPEGRTELGVCIGLTRLGGVVVKHNPIQRTGYFRQEVFSIVENGPVGGTVHRSAMVAADLDNRVDGQILFAAVDAWGDLCVINRCTSGSCHLREWSL